MPRALVKNAAHPDQVAYGKRREQSQRDHEFDVTAVQLSTYQGREYVWLLLRRFGVFDIHDGPMEFVYAANAAANKGRELWRDYSEQHAEAFTVMHQEALARAARSDREVEAAQTPSVTEKT